MQELEIRKHIEEEMAKTLKTMHPVNYLDVVWHCKRSYCADAVPLPLWSFVQMHHDSQWDCFSVRFSLSQQLLCPFAKHLLCKHCKLANAGHWREYRRCRCLDFDLALSWRLCEHMAAHGCMILHGYPM